MFTLLLQAIAAGDDMGKMNRIARAALTSGVCLSAIIFIGQSASAQDVPNTSAGVAAGALPPQNAAPAPDNGDIIVTANRREEFAQRVGVSITAVTQATLDQHDVRTTEDLGRLVPGLNASLSTGTGVSTIVIRGIGETDFSDHQEQPNATYQDGTYVPFSTGVGIPLFDLQRVEVLRGPQGTLFGRNATGGLIQYISNKPTEGFSGATEGAVGNRALRRAQGFVDDGNDIVAARLAYFYSTQHGVIDNVSGPDRGNKRVYALRGQVKITPGDDLTITLRAEGYNQNGTAPGYKSLPSYTVNGVDTLLPANVDAYGTGPGNDPYGYRNPYSGYKVSLDDPGVLDKRSRSYTATVEKMIGNATLSSLTSYGTIQSRYREDTDSTPLDEYISGLQSHGHDLQEDLRLSGAADRFRYTVGLFYLDIDGHYSFFNDIKYFPGIPGAREDEFYSLRTRSEAVYAQGEYDLTDRLTAILGGRYTWDQFHFDFHNYCTQQAAGGCTDLFGSPVGADAPVVNGIGPITLRDKKGDWSGKAQLNYTLSDTVLLYGSASKGLKSAGFNQTATNNFPLSSFEFKPETLYSYEVGEKAQFFDKRLTLNTGFYYYDYHDLQTFLFILNQTQVINRDASAYGGEIELTARPTRSVNANVGLAYSHFLIHDLVTDTHPDGNQRPVNAPRLQVNWGVNKTFDLADQYTLQLGYYGRYRSSVYYNILNAPLIRGPGYVLSDFNVRLDSKKGWYAGVDLTNAFNKHYLAGAFDVTGFGYALQLYGETRTVSGMVGIKF